MKPVSYLLRNDGPSNSMFDEHPPMDEPIRKRSKGLRPFRYFLFNSSVEARKNLLFLAQAYAESDLSSLGIQLCVTGKLKGDDYSKAVKNIVKNEPGILLTGYVDESTKLDLYLNALCLVSPSLVEGFGIPVLDGACLGMPTIASDCESHLEIQAIQDFKDSVITLDTLKSRSWAAAMQAIAGLNSDLWKTPAEERKRRIGRYERLRNEFYNQLQADLEAILD
jgi:glycosyltransferase involved in cell wall biosynthesis